MTNRVKHFFKTKLEDCDSTLSELKNDHQKEMNTRQYSEARTEGFLHKLREHESEDQHVAIKLEEESSKLELLAEERDMPRKEIFTLTAKQDFSDKSIPNYHPG